MYLIGLNGRLHSGKDTTFEQLDKLFGSRLRFKRVAFADKLKLSGMAALGLTQESDEATIALANRLKEVGCVTVDGIHDSEHVITGREFWQYQGTEAHRNIFGMNFWVDALLPRPALMNKPRSNQNALAAAFPGVDVLVVTDVRFPNEAERIIDLGGEVWLLSANERLGPLPEDAHSSEIPLESKYITRTLDANGTVGRLAISVTDTFTRMEIERRVPYSR